MTNNSLLDSRDKLAKLDKSNVLGSIEALPDQIRDAWEQTESLSFPPDFPNVKNIIVSGMGGSALGAHVIKNLYKDELTLPLEIYSHYHLPGYVNEDSLVILSSYSGNTEEVLAASEQAIKVGAKIIVITGGGKLLELALEHDWPHYHINPTYNPSGEPRMAIGYAVVGMLGVFSKLGIVNLSEKDLLDLTDKLEELIQKLSPDSVDGNMAKLLAYHAFDKMLILSGAEHLIGAVHVTNNQLNENAKLLTAEWHLPEFNHHYLEALTNPSKLREDTLFLLFNSHLYMPEVTKRVHLTADVIKQAGFDAEVIEATASTKLEQVFEIITLGSFLNFYLAMLYQLDPAPIPNVDHFKSEMAK